MLVSSSCPAQADNLKSSFTTISQIWTNSVVQVVRLSESGAVVLAFTNLLSGVVSVTYTAECQLIAATSSSLVITILIDGTAILPSGPDAAFCSGPGGKRHRG